MRRFLTALTALFLFFGSCLAEELPVFIDRITQPDAAPEFAFPEEAELFQIIFPNMQEADCALLISGEDVVMIDCSSSGYAWRVVNMLEQLGIDEIDLILNTHPHHDHLLGLDQISTAVKVHEIAFAFPETETKHMIAALRVAEKRGIQVSWYGDGDRFPVGDGWIDAWLKGDAEWSLNARSAQMRVQFGERTALFTADSLHETQRRLVEAIAPELLDCDVLKYPHHGLEVLDDGFLEAVSPAYAVITHIPCDATFKARGYLTQQKVPFGFTTGGYLSFTTDGHVWLAEKLPMRPVSAH